MDLHRGLRRGRGFTLTEVLVSMAVMSLVAAGAVMILMVALSLERQAWAQSMAKDTGYVAVERVSREVREATLVRIPDPEGNVLEVHRRDDSIIRFVVQAQANGWAWLVLYRDVEKEDYSLVARQIMPIPGEPVFRRNQNVIYISFRAGDAVNREDFSLAGAAGIQGLDIRTVAALRKGIK